MIVELMKEQQQREINELRRLSKSNRTAAVERARENLLSAKIIDADCRLAGPYRGGACTQG